MRSQHYKKNERLLLFFWISILLIVGLLSVRDFGISYDEIYHYNYANISLDAYKSFFGIRSEPFYGPANMRFYGPIFDMIGMLIFRFLHLVTNRLSEIWVYHYSYYTVFVFTGICLYSMAKRWFSNWTSWTIMVIFTAQPLLWGHGFINGKDIPFMFFFTYSLVSGFTMVDAINVGNPGKSIKDGIKEIPAMWRKFIKIRLRFDFKEILISFREFRFILFNKNVVWAGIVLGLSTSVRILGPFAGFCVIVFLFFKSQRKFISAALSYFCWAGLTTYLTWPFLWRAPISNFFESIRIMSDYPWRGTVLFNGKFYSPDALPISYLPVLMNIQFTIPFLILFYIGMGLLLWRLSLKKVKVDLLIYIGLCSIIPVFGFIVFRPTIYDNFRQLLFLIPPLFIVAGITVESIYSIIRKPMMRLILIFGFSIAGIFALIKLHPYQYTYYNSFVGGVGGAFRRFELDYWMTSSMELTKKINQDAGLWSKVYCYQAAPIVEKYYLRPDLIPEREEGIDLIPSLYFDYAIINSRFNADIELFPQADVIDTVGRDGAVYGVLKSLSSSLDKPEVALPLTAKNSFITADTSLEGIIGIANIFVEGRGIEYSDDQGFFWLGEGERRGLRGFLWSEQEMPVQMLIRVVAGDGRQDKVRNIALKFFWHETYSGIYNNRLLEGSREERIRFEESEDIVEIFHLQKGWNEFQLYSLDKATNLELPYDNPRELLVLIQKIKFMPFDEDALLLNVHSSLRDNVSFVEEYLPEWGV